MGTLYVMKSRPLQDVHVDSIYKSKDVSGGRVAAQQKEDMFPEVRDTLRWFDSSWTVVGYCLRIQLVLLFIFDYLVNRIDSLFSFHGIY